MCCFLDANGGHSFSKSRPYSLLWRNCGSYAEAQLICITQLMSSSDQNIDVSSHHFCTSYSRESIHGWWIALFLCYVPLFSVWPTSAKQISLKKMCVQSVCLDHTVQLGHFWPAVFKLLTTALVIFVTFPWVM